jgi:hypothetical protein
MALKSIQVVLLMTFLLILFALFQLGRQKPTSMQREIKTDTYEQLNGNCDLFYDFLETYSYFAPQRRKALSQIKLV